VTRTPTADEIIAALNLSPLPLEGGYFRETWRSEVSVPVGGREPASRSAGTAIYYLLTPDTFSALHRLPDEEIFHFYLGDPAEMLVLEPSGRARVVTLGPDLLAGQHPQFVVPRGAWQGTKLASGGKVALLGATIAPGFEFRDLELGARDALTQTWPDYAEKIAALTR
jgi:uncharacterized protein